MTGQFFVRWTEFWFTPSPISSLRNVRRGLCLVAAVYFASALADVDTWLTRGAPASSSNLATFFRTAELTGDARWMVSPLFIWDAVCGESPLGESALVYRLYLLVGIALAIFAAAGDRLAGWNAPKKLAAFGTGSGPTVLLWIWFVGWANRVVLLAGTVEPVLSLSLAAVAIAPAGRVTAGRVTAAADAAGGSGAGPISWRATLASRLLSVQATFIALITTATLLASPVWWNGTGAYALVAPAEDRFLNVIGTFFETPLVYELLTALIVCMLPIGVFLAWQPATRKIGVWIMIVWSGFVGLLSANLLYAVTLGIIATTIGALESHRTPAGVIGAKSLDDGSTATKV
ncbi:hypothetical protein Mal15_41500 [Stieleria maiorica]|uniref:HTTM domain-containing protein n=1 Tax=Stieleria maiorica TaxID=2795974 RepID=A0A5B9MJD5_9BACT|nr:hypothetical protein [Stieleria maiorica]QEG00081.1 hypothetical protein Mal15_41500 [Stieleria maiorica]